MHYLESFNTNSLPYCDKEIVDECQFSDIYTYPSPCTSHFTSLLDFHVTKNK